MGEGEAKSRGGGAEEEDFRFPLFRFLAGRSNLNRMILIFKGKTFVRIPIFYKRGRSLRRGGASGKIYRGTFLNTTWKRKEREKPGKGILAFRSCFSSSYSFFFFFFFPPLRKYANMYRNYYVLYFITKCGYRFSLSEQVRGVDIRVRIGIERYIR